MKLHEHYLEEKQVVIVILRTLLLVQRLICRFLLKVLIYLLEIFISPKEMEKSGTKTGHL